jgi:hypothetical protein
LPSRSFEIPSDFRQKPPSKNHRLSTNFSIDQLENNNEENNGSIIKIRPNQIVGSCQYGDCDTYKNEIIWHFFKNSLIISVFNSSKFQNNGITQYENCPTSLASDSCSTEQTFSAQSAVREAARAVPTTSIIKLCSQKKFKIFYNPKVYNESLIDNLRLVSKFWYFVFKKVILNRGEHFLTYYDVGFAHTSSGRSPDDSNRSDFINVIPRNYYNYNIPNLMNKGHHNNAFYVDYNHKKYNTCLICENLNNAMIRTPTFESWQNFKILHSKIKRSVERSDARMKNEFIEQKFPFLNFQDDLIMFPNNDDNSSELLKDSLPMDCCSNFYTVLGGIYDDNNNPTYKNIITKCIVHSLCYGWLKEYIKKHPNFNDWAPDKKERVQNNYIEPTKEFIKLLCDINSKKNSEIYSGKIWA